MTEPPRDDEFGELPPEGDQPIDPEAEHLRRREIWAGVGYAIGITALALAFTTVTAQFGSALLIGIAGLIVLGVLIARRGSAFGLGVAAGCGVILVIGGGICVALINSLSNI